MVKWLRCPLLLALALTVLIGSCATATAAEDNPFIDGMALGSINGDGSYYAQVSANGSFAYNFITPLQVAYVDITMRISGAVPTKVTVGGYAMSLFKISSNLYRVYGDLSRSTAVNSLAIKFTSTGTSYATIVNFSLGVSQLTSYQSSGSIYRSGSSLLASWAVGGSGSFTITGDADYESGFTQYEDDIWVTIHDWQGADYIEILVKTVYFSTASIAGYMNQSPLPIEVDPLYSTDDLQSFSTTDGYIYNDDTVSEYDGYNWESGTSATRVFRVRIDLRGIDREAQEAFDPIVRFSLVATNLYDATFTVGSTLCFVDTGGLDGLAIVGIWFRDVITNIASYSDNLGNVIGEGLNNILLALTGQDTEYSENFQQEAIKDSDELDQAVEDMNQVTEPPIEDVNPELDEYITPDDMAIVSDEFAELTNNTMVVTMMMIVLTVGLVAYILYGKR